MGSDADRQTGQLLALAQTGDVAALGQLLDTHRNYLSLLARLGIHARLQSKVDASDVVQEAYLGAYRDFVQFRGSTPAEFACWLRQVLAHVISNLVRHYQGTQQRDVRLERRLEASFDQSSLALERAFVDPGLSPSQNVAGKEMRLIVADALAKLDPVDRDLLVLRHIEGLSFPRLAERMERSVDSVKRLWPRALGRFRRQVKELCNQPEELADV